MLNMGTGKIGSISTDTPLTYEGKTGQSLTLKSGRAKINNMPMQIGIKYELKNGDKVVIYEGATSCE